MTDPESQLGNRLGDLLDRAAPGSPALDPASRTAAVVRRGRAARRRDRGLVAGTAAVVLALAVGVPLALGGDDDPAEVASPPSPAPTAAPCPEDVDQSSITPAADLTDVLSVRSCPIVWKGLAVAESELPSAPLTGDAAIAFAQDVVALPAQDPGKCAAIDEMPRPWALVAESSEGDQVVLGSNLRTCGAVDVLGTRRDAEQVLAAFMGNLERQQARNLTPGADGPSCPVGDPLVIAATWNASFDVSSATAGMVCYVADPMGLPQYAATEGKLHLDTLATIRDDLSEGVSSAPHNLGSCVDTGPTRLLVLTNDAGDRVSYLDNRCTGEFQGPLGYWQPSDAAEVAIRSALGGGFSPR